MWSRLSPHTRAALAAVLVTFLWSTSWVLIKLGLRDDIPPLTFAGLRYTLAFLCLLPVLLWRRSDYRRLRAGSPAEWLRLTILGILFYAVAQGAQFVGLALLPAVTVNLLLSLIALVVTFAGIRYLGERPRPLQWLGLVIYLGGVGIYFFPIALPADQTIGVLVVLAGVAATAAATLMSRQINREASLGPLAVTVASMGIGAIILLGAGIGFQGLPPISPSGWAMIVWLAVVNTAFAFTLWNYTLRTLAAMEASLINNLMMVQIPVLAWLFLGEGIGLKAGIGFALAAAGILVVQARGG